MNPNTPSFGSGTALLGAPASAVLGMPHGMMQQSPASPSFSPGIMPPPANLQGAPSMSQAPQMAQFPGSQPVPNALPQTPQAPLGQGTVGLPPAAQESMLIVKALISRLQNHSKGDAMARGET